MHNKDSHDNNYGGVRLDDRCYGNTFDITLIKDTYNLGFFLTDQCHFNDITIDAITNTHVSPGIYLSAACEYNKITFGTISGCGGTGNVYGLYISNCFYNKIFGTRITGSRTANIYILVDSTENELDIDQLDTSPINIYTQAINSIYNCAMSVASTCDVQCYRTKLTCNNCTFGSATGVGGNTYTSGNYPEVRSILEAGTANNHKVYLNYGAVVSTVAAGERNGSTGFAWKLSPTDADFILEDAPLQFTMFQINGIQGTNYLIRVWAKRDNTGIGGGFKVDATPENGITSVQSAVMTAAIDTWELLEKSVTAQKDGLIEVLGFAYGGSAYNLFLDPTVTIGVIPFIKGHQILGTSGSRQETISIT